MNVLIQREMEGEIASDWQERIIYHVMYGVVLIIFMWLLGPRVLDLFSIRAMDQFVSVMVVLVVSSTLNEKLKNDSINRQMSFLQTLPVSKSQLVHAKFLHMLLLWCMAFVWLSSVISVNFLLNGGWTFDWWTHVWGFTSALLFIQAMTLLCYFSKGYQGVQAVFYLSALAWATIFIPLGLTLEETGLSKGGLWGIALMAAFIIYVISWLMAVRKVNAKGVPEESWDDLATDEVS
ncbi:ABC-2 transporter permease [Lentibacillus cibarius]|uniref:ABC-2 transporter permease n=1 Tax=Lentibacillus cibarius TaxID=2583219 RepID=A0A549YJW1_9BACI|nr:ABC-2 transporter permease [Lentibacillus cibarius]TRM12161.1 ABC-2 transporter permease [Lentibacillus cibarius]